MISITDKKDCCGCSACVQRCPKQCITMHSDEEGFLYPVVDKSACIDCGLCEKICPVINQDEPKKPLKVYAAKNPNEEIRIKSSSGGIFTMLAERTINNGGVVFGARFNENWEVVHSYAESIDDIAAFRGSKYVQSRIGDTYCQTEKFLKDGREVLFSGTPCQIAGLRRFLRKDYKSLITADIVCHGVPSPLVWREYLDSLFSCNKVGGNMVSDSLKTISDISFRDKKYGWKKYGFAVRQATDKTCNNSVYRPTDKSQNDEIVLHETLGKNVFMRGFLKDLYLRPSCYSCPAKAGKSGSDITIADFWGIANYHPDFDDDKGCSLILLNTEKGCKTYNNLITVDIETQYDKALNGNPSVERSVQIPKLRKEFWKKFRREGVNCILPICEKKPSVIRFLLGCIIAKANTILNPK